jgi:hypothetical protein
MLLIYDYEKQHFAPWLLKSNILVWLVNAKNLAKAPSSMGGNWRASRRIIIIKWLQLLFFFQSAYSHGSQLQSTLLQKRSSCVMQAVCRKKASRLIYWFGQLMIGAFFIDWLNTPPPLHLAITITNKPAIYDYEKQHLAPWLLKSNILAWLVNAKNLTEAPSSMGGNIRKVVIGWVTCSGPIQDRNCRA